SAAALDGLVGRYELAPGPVAVIGRDGDRLTFGIGPGPGVKLIVSSDSVFSGEDVPGTLTFVRGEGGPGLVVSAFGKDRAPRLGEPPVLTAVDRAAFVG